VAFGQTAGCLNAIAHFERNGGSSNERSRGSVVTVAWLATSNIRLAMIRIMLRRLAANASP
jgi:hypothetical protein